MTDTCPHGHRSDWYVYPSGRRECRPCKRATRRVRLRCPSWHDPLPPDAVDAERWRRFCLTIDARIAAERPAPSVDRARILAGRIGRAA